MLRAHKIALDPNKQQATFFAKCCGVARAAYNWALEQWQKQYQSGRKPQEAALRKQLNQCKYDQFPWMLEVPKSVPQQAIKDLGKAFERFFVGQNDYPMFKKKYQHDSCRLDNGPPAKGRDALKVKGKQIKIPKLGWVRMCESVRFSGQIKCATLSREADRWFVSLLIETETIPSAHKNHVAVGVDLGITALATLSTSEKVAGPKPYTAHLHRLRRLDRRVCRRQHGSQNRKKAARGRARLQRRIANIRTNALHKLTTRLTQQFSTIVMEDLNVDGMRRNLHLSRAISDMGFGEFKRQLLYKAEQKGCQIILAPRFFPSSKRCSVCAHVLEALSLSVRQWRCPQCGTAHDRDVNAALNLQQLATASSAGSYACGDSSDGGTKGGGGPPFRSTSHESLKQELNAKHPLGIFG